MKKALTILLATTLYFSSYSIIADEQGDKEREELVKENEKRNIDSKEYNQKQSVIEKEERKRAKDK